MLILKIICRAKQGSLPALMALPPDPTRRVALCQSLISLIISHPPITQQNRFQHASSRPGDSSKDYYKVLGIAQDASLTAIRSAYVEKSKKLHPDINRSDPNSHAKFTDLQEAYSVLRNSSTRREYDMQRSIGSRSSRNGSSSDFRSGSGPEYYYEQARRARRQQEARNSTQYDYWSFDPRTHQEQQRDANNPNSYYYGGYFYRESADGKRRAYYHQPGDDPLAQFRRRQRHHNRTDDDIEDARSTASASLRFVASAFIVMAIGFVFLGILESVAEREEAFKRNYDNAVIYQRIHDRPSRFLDAPSPSYEAAFPHLSGNPYPYSNSPEIATDHFSRLAELERLTKEQNSKKSTDAVNCDTKQPPVTTEVPQPPSTPQSR